MTADPLEIPHKLPSKYYTSIGKIVSSCAHLEHNVENLIWLLLDIKHKEGRLLTTGMQFRSKLNLLEELASHYAPNQQIADSIAELCKASSPLAGIRNDVAHGVWAHPRSNPKLLYVLRVFGKMKHRIKPERILYTAESMAEHAKAITKLAFDARWILIGIHFPPSPTPSPRKSRKKSARSRRGP